MTSLNEPVLINEVIDPVWDITKVPLVDNSTKEREFRTMLDVTGNSMFTTHTPSTNTIQFQIRDNNSYLKMYDSYLKIRLRLVRSDGSALQPGDIVAFSNNVGYSLFQSASLRINTKAIQHVENVDHVTMLRLLTKLSKEELITRGPEFFFYDYPEDNSRNLDPASLPTEEFEFDDVDKVVTRNPGFNKSFTMRHKKSATNQDIVINLPLKYMFSFFDDLPDLLLKRADIDIDLNITSNLNKCIEVVEKEGGYTGGFKPWIRSVHLKVQMLLPTTTIEQRLYEAYNNEFYSKLIYNNTVCEKYTSHTQGTSTIEWRVASLSGKLNSIYFMFKNRADENAEDKVSNVYDNALVKNLYVKVGSRQYPAEQISCNFNQNDYSDAYVRFIESTKRIANRIDEQSIVTWENYPTKYPIFFVDLSCDDGDSANITEEIQLYVELDTPAGGSIQPYSIFAIIEQEKMMLLSMHKEGRIAVS